MRTPEKSYPILDSKNVLSSLPSGFPPDTVETYFSVCAEPTAGLSPVSLRCTLFFSSSSHSLHLRCTDRGEKKAGFDEGVCMRITCSATLFASCSYTSLG